MHPSRAGRPRSAAGIPAVLVLALVAGCGSPAAGGGSAAAPTASAAAPAACPSTYAAPDPHRPRIAVDFDVADDLTRVTGTETVTFRPDLPITEVVFRLVGNDPSSHPSGTQITVQRASVRAAGTTTTGMRFEAAGAPADTQGGLLVLPLPQRLPAGGEVTATLDFTLVLGNTEFDRFGRTGDLAWFGSAQPLLAWERGAGWRREPLTRYLGESATSEAARFDLSVTAPAWATVMSSGQQQPPVPAPGSRRLWRAQSATARDVSVAVGRLTVRQERLEHTTVSVGAPEAAMVEPAMRQVRRAVTELSRRFGPFPFPTLAVTVLPNSGGGIEYPGSILLFGSSPVVDVHEVAHQWFYGLVGDDQASDPWLDEAFASYAEQLVNGYTPPPSDVATGAAPVATPGVGAAINDFPSDRDYFDTVYGRGSAALHAARAAAGAGAFDAAIRCYVNANAWRIARPADLARALAGLPKALAVLREAGALP